MTANSVGIASIPENFEDLEVYVPQLRARPLNLLSDVSLSAATATGAGAAIYTAGYGQVLWTINALSVTTGGTILIQGCVTNSGLSTDWYTIATVTVTASGTQSVAIAETQTHIFMRANLTARTDGAYSTKTLANRLPGSQTAGTSMT